MSSAVAVRVRVLLAGLVALTGGALAASATAEPYYLGPKVCEECHENETKVWEATKHAKSYKKFHKLAKTKAILEKAGTARSAKKDPVCTQCHYTMVSRKPGAKPRAKAGPSCESCHGPASEWKETHQDFGKYKKPEAEPPEHKEKRLAAARAQGMIYSSMHYDIAANCMSCHGLARSTVEAPALAKLLAAEHPFRPDFELVRYSQGSVRHRFYPPDVNVNKEMTKPELARFFVVGQAAKLVSAAAAAARANDPAYKAAQEKRVAAARQALGALKGMPEAAALLATPTEANARALVEAIRTKDLTAQVGSLIPPSSTWK